MATKEQKHGARVFLVSTDVILIKQTVKKGMDKTDPYVIDENKERHVNIKEDAAIANAIRDAVHGNLTAGKQEASASGSNLL